MIKIDKFSGLKIIDSTNDLLEFMQTNNGVDTEFEIQLFDDETKKSKNFDLLKEVVKNVDNLKNQYVGGVNLIVPYEKINREAFVAICNLFVPVKDKFDFNICVNHRFVNNQDLNFVDVKRQIKWDIKTIVKANLEIDKVCDFIKQNNFSPLEALSYIHQYVGSSAKYRPSRLKDRNWIEKDQYFAGIFQQYNKKIPEVVCMGYSSLMKEIIDHLNMPGLECDVITTAFHDKKTNNYENHARCHVKLNDNKYKIKRTCVCDVEADRGKTFTQFAMSSKCHRPEYNSRFIFIDEPKLDELFREDALRKVIDINWRRNEYDKSRKRFSQHMIEEAYFTTLITQTVVDKKTGEVKKMNFEEAYEKLEQITDASYKDQIEMGYVKGLINKEKPELSKEEAKKIYETQEKSILKQLDIETEKKAQENKYFSEEILGE